MNCKPGDLAILVGGLDGRCPPPLGSIVRVTVLNDYYPDSWELDPPIFDPRDGFCVVILDMHLRPIRDPGDDAVDETLLWLPVPETEVA